MRYFLVELTVTGTIEEATLIAQRAFLQKMTEEGRLVLAGSLPDRPGRGAAILRAGSLEEARAMVLSVAQPKPSGEVLDRHARALMFEGPEMTPPPEEFARMVLEEIRKGYKIREKLLRPALVRIAANPDQVSD